MKSKIEQFIIDGANLVSGSQETREEILDLRIIKPKRIRQNKQTYITFVIIEKAFDNMN